jgi:hypothetical protein
MYVWNANWSNGIGVNLANLDSLLVTGSDTSWGIQGSSNGGGVTIASNGTYASKAAAVTALEALLQYVGYVDLS